MQIAARNVVLVPLFLICCTESQSSDDAGASVADQTDATDGNVGGAHSGPNGGSGGKHTNGGSGGSHAGGMSNAGNGNASGGTDPGSGGAGGTVAECVPNPVCSPDTPPSSGNIYDDCVARINQFRTECLCMEPLARWTEAESCADQHAEYDSTRPPHSGFRDEICEPGAFGQNECPGWNSARQVIDGCLQQMWNEGPPPTDPCDGECFQEYGHFINMTNPDFTRVACGFFTTSDGEIWSVQNFR